MRKMAWLLVTAFGLAGEAHATGGFSCSIEDKAVKLSVEGLFTRGMGEPVLNFGGNIEVLSKQVPADLRTFELGRNNLAQTWLHGKDIKLKIYQELEGNAPHGSVEVVIETRQTPRDELEYAGTYVLNVFYMAPEPGGDGKTFTAHGRASCSAG